MCNQWARTICVDASTLPFSIHFVPRVFTELPSVFGFISISAIHSVTERQISDDTTWNQHLNSSASNLPAEDGAWWASVFVRRQWKLIHQTMLKMLLKFKTTGRIYSEFISKPQLGRSQPSYHLDLFLPDHQAALSSCCVQPGPPWLPSSSTSRYLALGSQHLTFYVGKGYIFHMHNPRPGSPHGCTLCRIAVGSILKTIILKLLLWLLFPYFHFSLIGGFAPLWNNSLLIF